MQSKELLPSCDKLYIKIAIVLIWGKKRFIYYGAFLPKVIINVKKT